MNKDIVKCSCCDKEIDKTTKEYYFSDTEGFICLKCWEEKQTCAEFYYYVILKAEVKICAN